MKNKSLGRSLLLIALVFVSPLSIAEEFETDRRGIEKIRFYGAERPSNPTYTGIAIVKLESGGISGNQGTCRTNEFAVLNSDKSMLSALLSARFATEKVALTIEKDMKYGNGTFCRVVKVDV